MPKRNWVSFAPVGVGIVAILMLLASALVNYRNDYECALGAARCRAPAASGGFAARPLPAETPATDQLARLIQSSADQGALMAPAILLLIGAALVLVAASFILLLMVGRHQRRLERAHRATEAGKAAATERLIKLVESTAAVIRALDARADALEAGVKAFDAATTALEEGLVAVAAVLTQVREDQLAGGELAAETAERLDRAMASATEELGRYRQTLVADLLPNIARRDERLVAIDANLTAVSERLSRLSSDTQHNIRETAVLTEIVRALEASVSGRSRVSVDLGQPPQHSPEPSPEVVAEPASPPVAAAGPEPSQAAEPAEPAESSEPPPEPDTAAGSHHEPTSDERGVSNLSPTADEAAGSHRTATSGESAAPDPSTSDDVADGA